MERQDALDLMVSLESADRQDRADKQDQQVPKEHVERLDLPDPPDQLVSPERVELQDHQVGQLLYSVVRAFRFILSNI